MQRDIRLDAFYPYPPADVWTALTSRRELASWLMENDFEARPGAQFHFQSKPMPGWDGRVDCQVQEIDGLRRLSYSWIGARDMPRTTVTWSAAMGLPSRAMTTPGPVSQSVASPQKPSATKVPVPQ